jgi:hypothetical protein
MAPMPVNTPWKEPAPDLPLVSREQFLAGCRIRFGQTNPDLISDPYLEYMIRTGHDPFFVRRDLGLPTNRSSADADWCFHMHGATNTLYRGRFILSIGGTVEDSSDPDFQIYNDVIVQDLSGRIWIYLYPRHVFPPIDFHTATTIQDDAIVLIGGLGYPEDRSFGVPRSTC